MKLEDLDKEFDILYIRNSFMCYNNYFEISLNEFKNKLKYFVWVKFEDSSFIGYYCVPSNNIVEINRLSNMYNNIQIKFQGFKDWFPITQKQLLTIIT